MLLAVDVGNSNVVVGVFDAERLVQSWRLSTRRESTADELQVLLRSLLGDALAGIRDAVVASVVPPLTAPMMEAIRGLCGVSPLEVEPGVKTGLRIRSDNPQEVGADRVLNAIAAHVRHTGAVIVIDFGTATTLDVVTGGGDYLGGVICPGPRLGGEALSARAARLPPVDLQVPPRVIGRNTIDSIRSGLLHGHAAMVDGLVRRIEAELGVATTVIATGGLAPVVGPLMDRLDGIEPDLTLEGLRLVHQRNRPR
jgi:type III pantothenate kinase